MALLAAAAHLQNSGSPGKPRGSAGMMSLPDMRSAAPLPGGNRAGTGFAGRQSSTRTPAENQVLPRQSVANQASPPRMRLVHWRPVTGGKLRGRATILLPIGLKIAGVCIFRTERGTWEICRASKYATQPATSSGMMKARPGIARRSNVQRANCNNAGRTRFVG
jgi:hypothetical protein